MLVGAMMCSSVQGQEMLRKGHPGGFTTARLDSFFASYMSAYHIPGLAACIVRKDSIVWQGYYGYANIARGLPVTDSTIFMLASISKTITATALMQLYERGRFRLDDSVNTFLPFPVRNPYQPGSAITFKMLLTHTSSLKDNWNVLNYVYVIGDHPMSLAAFVQHYFSPGGQYYSQSGNFHTYTPGTSWDYCNVGAALCGYLVEQISGVPFDQYCRDSIFVPLGMTRTAWFLKDLTTDLIAHPYTYSYGSYADNGLFGYPDYPDGQLRTTATSLARFLIAHLNGGALGNVRILDSSTIRLMRTAYAAGNHPGWVDWRAGLIWTGTTDIDGTVLWGHTGGDTGVETAMFLSERDSIGIVMLTNTYFGDSEWKSGMRQMLSEALTAVSVRVGTAAFPERCQLFQNYPNPFNPNSDIRYQISEFSNVRLAVYDVLGREVAVLVDEKKAPGTYQVRFDASVLPSGVYFYRLQSGRYTETKKLLLIR
jgi:CubicO group peptidase (beta-lactamase class C family)